MTWKTGTIKLEAAQTIFAGVQFVELKCGEKTVGYRARFGDRDLEDTSLTRLCSKLWITAQSDRADIEGSTLVLTDWEQWLQTLTN